MDNIEKTVGIQIISVIVIFGGVFLTITALINIVSNLLYRPPVYLILPLVQTILRVCYCLFGYKLQKKSHSAWQGSIIVLHIIPVYGSLFIFLLIVLPLAIYLPGGGISFYDFIANLAGYLFYLLKYHPVEILLFILSLSSLVYLIRVRDEFSKQPRTEVNHQFKS